MSRGIKRQLRCVSKGVQTEISAIARNGGKYGAGLASEGYLGGYAQAISDVTLALNGVHPNNSRFERYWRKQHEPS